jgi:hypothetical protein
MNDDENTPWQYKSDKGHSSAMHQDPDDDTPAPVKRKSAHSVSWEAPEFIEHRHGPGWYLALVISTLAFAFFIYVITKDIIATAIIIIVGIILWIFAGQKPGLAKYEIDDRGITINGKLYNYGDYKSFALISEGVLSSVNLFPLKRFMPPLSAYFEPEDEAKIKNVLGEYLPYENRQLENIERLSRRLRL